MTTQDKYKNVGFFRQLTDLLIQLMDEGDMSPTDVIESARLACEMYNDADVVYNREEV